MVKEQGYHGNDADDADKSGRIAEPLCAFCISHVSSNGTKHF